METSVPWRVRQRAALLVDIRRTAHHLFAERGFDAVTTEDIAAAVGISPSTFFRHVSSKEGLLVEPVLEHISGLVAAYEYRPASEDAGAALVAAMIDHMREPRADDIDMWLNAIRSAPHLIGRVALVSADDRARLIELAADRMHVDGPRDLRPALLVQIVLAASEYVFQQWIAGTAPAEPPLPEQVRSALTTILTADW